VKHTRLHASLLLIVLLLPAHVWGWGFHAHRQITGRAVSILPEPLRAMMISHVDALAERSTEPDRIRRTDSLEQYNHFIDIDYYGEYPFSGLPRTYDAAVEKYGADTVRRYGLLPWKISEFTDRLTDAFRKGDHNDIMHCAAYLAHYVGDAHVPLHTTLNYDGQRTNQHGLHRRFESEIPERFSAQFEYDLPSVIPAISDPLDQAFRIVLESFVFMDSILIADTRAKELTGFDWMSNRSPSEQKSTKLNMEFYKVFNAQTGDLPRRRMEAATVAIARYWLTAWENAGQPEFNLSQ
jgi:hypothetical protein